VYSDMRSRLRTGAEEPLPDAFAGAQRPSWRRWAIRLVSLVREGTGGAMFSVDTSGSVPDFKTIELLRLGFNHLPSVRYGFHDRKERQIRNLLDVAVPDEVAVQHPIPQIYMQLIESRQSRSSDQFQQGRPGRKLSAGRLGAEVARRSTPCDNWRAKNCQIRLSSRAFGAQSTVQAGRDRKLARTRIGLDSTGRALQAARRGRVCDRNAQMINVVHQGDPAARRESARA
jgi:hypothetical protein